MNTEQDRNNIAQLKADVERLSAEIVYLTSRRQALRQRIAEAHAQFSVGSRVTDGKRFWEIVAISPPRYSWNRVDYVGRLVKKDGTLGVSKTVLDNYGDRLVAA